MCVRQSECVVDAGKPSQDDVVQVFDSALSVSTPVSVELFLCLRGSSSWVGTMRVASLVGFKL